MILDIRQVCLLLIISLKNQYRCVTPKKIRLKISEGTEVNVSLLLTSPARAFLLIYLRVSLASAFEPVFSQFIFPNAFISAPWFSFLTLFYISTNITLCPLSVKIVIRD